MDDEDVRHWQHLIEEHKRHLRVLEEQAAGYGKLACPPHITLAIEDTKREIDKLQQRIRRRLRNAQNGNLFNAEEIDEIAEKSARIAQLEQMTPMREDVIKKFREVFDWRH